MQTALTTAPASELLPVHSDGLSRRAEGFREGDEVVLATGTHQGTLGVFLRLKPDVNWADIRERNGDIRSHPLVWLAHSDSATPGFSKAPKENDE